MEKFMKKMWKKSEGFTLVELIVVIAILGILAAIAVPAYSGYITKANEAADITALDAVKTAAVAALAEKEAVTEIEVTLGTKGVISKVIANEDEILMGAGTGETVSDFADEFVMYLGTPVPSLKSATFEEGAVWAGSAWTAPTADGE